ncbi:host nuclease inhibitor protein [Raoultella sp. C349492]|uniref:host nuclease inhibitor protein n=1 Tax=Raoultella sp. C349492 TaxID=2970253 RepID=UPI0035C6F5CF
MKVIAYAWASGLIQFGTKVPNGALPIISGQEDDVKNIIMVIARHSRTNNDLLVPGVPEAPNQHEGMNAFIKFTRWAQKDYAALIKDKELQDE